MWQLWFQEYGSQSKSLEHNGFLLKGTTEKAINEKGGFLINVTGLSMRVGLQLMKNVLTTLAKNILTPLGLKAAVSATDAGIQRNMDWA